MKPESPVSHLGPESTPTQERVPGVERSNELKGPEIGIETGAERFEARAEHSAAVADIGKTTLLPTPVIDDQTVVNDTIIDTPLVAGDDDLIEKEWVDRAKKIVADTKSDPYKREEQVSKLQVDYQKKRYGRELGATD